MTALQNAIAAGMGLEHGFTPPQKDILTATKFTIYNPLRERPDIQMVTGNWDVTVKHDKGWAHQPPSAEYELDKDSIEIREVLIDSDTIEIFDRNSPYWLGLLADAIADSLIGSGVTE